MSVFNGLELDDGVFCFVFSEKSSEGDITGKKKKKPKKNKGQTWAKEGPQDPFKVVCIDCALC